MSTQYFVELGLSDPILRVIDEIGYIEPTLIQKQVIPLALSGQSLYITHTASGKMGSFIWTILQRLCQPDASSRQHWILVPNHERAAEIYETIIDYSKYLSCRTILVTDHSSLRRQIFRLNSSPNIIIATPTSLLDHITQTRIDTSQLATLVLDNIDPNRLRDIKTLLGSLLLPLPQCLLFALKNSSELQNLVNQIMPEAVSLDDAALLKPTISSEASYAYLVPDRCKRELLVELIKKQKWDRCVVLTQHKHGAIQLAEILTKEGIGAQALAHEADLETNNQLQKELNAGKSEVLLIADLEIEQLTLNHPISQLVCYDLPEIPARYLSIIERIGFSLHNNQITLLVYKRELPVLQQIEQLLHAEFYRASPEEFLSLEKLSKETTGTGKKTHRKNNNKPSKKSSSFLSEAARHQSMPQTPAYIKQMDPKRQRFHNK